MIEFARKYQSIAHSLKMQFKKTEKNTWNISSVCLEYIVQLGHLIYIENKDSSHYIVPFIKDNGSLEDEICDLMFQTFNLANFCGLNLSNELSKLDTAPSYLTSMEIVYVIINYLGNLCDCILILSKYKDRSYLKEDVITKRLIENIVNLYICIYALAECYKLDVYRSFDKMLKDTNQYLESY